MSTITIILAVYVALDVISALVILLILRLNGWTLFELARGFRAIMGKPQEDFVEYVADTYGLVDPYDEEDYDDYDEDSGTDW